MNDEHFINYLGQEGISEESIKNGKKILFVDTGFKGSIPKKIDSLFSPESQKNIQTHLILSENSSFPSSKTFLRHLSSWAPFLKPKDIHGKIIALEHLPHTMERSDQFKKINGKYQPLSVTGGNPVDSLKYQQDLLSFAKSENSSIEFNKQRGLWKQIYQLHKENNKEKIVSFFKNSCQPPKVGHILT